MIKSVNWAQNFLGNPALVERLINGSSITDKDLVLDIGAGKGVITDILSKRCRQVVAIENDLQLFSKLKERFISNPKIKLLQTDFLHYQLPTLPYKVFANIPFNITADIIRKLFNGSNPPGDCYLIMQQEAAYKFTGSPKESQFSLLLKPWFEISVSYRFKRTDFYPVPKVEIVLIRINSRSNPLVTGQNRQFYRDFIVYSFNTYKPTLKQGLKKIFSNLQWQRLAQELRFSQTATPTQLTVAQWVGLFKFFLSSVPVTKQRIVVGAEQRWDNQQKQLTKIHRTRTRGWQKR